MKAKKVLITLLALGTALSFTACNGETTEKETAKTESAKTESSKTETTNTETTEADKTETVKADTENTETEHTGSDTAQITYEETDTDPSDNTSDPELDNLYQQENQLFADHKDAWDKAFGLMSKSSALKSIPQIFFLIQLNQTRILLQMSSIKLLQIDIETIRKIEEQIAELEKKNAETDTSETKTASDDSSPFNNFSGKDFDGNSVDESLFSKNAVTVVNFWFTGCKPCVAELSKLNELNDAIKSMGGEVVGINTETFDGNEDAIKEAASILESQGAKYRNLSIDSDSDAGKYASSIMAFPTTILVDRNGNIVGDPMLGGIDNQDDYDALMKQIQSVIDADSTEK